MNENRNRPARTRRTDQARPGLAWPKLRQALLRTGTNRPLLLPCRVAPEEESEPSARWPSTNGWLVHGGAGDVHPRDRFCPGFHVALMVLFHFL